MEATLKMVARPVWARRERRAVGLALDPPTDEERADAIRVLQDGIRIPPSLYAEAEAIMRECHEGRSFTRLELLRDVHEDFLEDDGLD